MDEFASRQYPVQEHMAFQRRTWIVQRIGWFLLVAICFSAIMGLFGGGALGNRTIEGGAMTIEFERFERRTRTVHFTFRFAPSDHKERRLHLGGAFQEACEVSRIQPLPLRSVAPADGLDLTFAAAPPASSRVTIWARPHSYGSIDIHARADDGAPTSFSVFISP